jgi:glucosamine--fructose-6-phosphate aminotransferase (isomerizing)
MCGIVGYVGSRPALQIVLDGLRRLEYRGYDSAGVAVVDDSVIVTEKKAGKLANLEKALAERPGDGISVGCTAIGHTRWATHGGPTDRNAHPHLSADGRVAVIHNGIIENFGRLRAELEAAGVEFVSDTDTECAAHLLAAEMRALRAAGGEQGPQLLAEGMRRVVRRLEGAFTAFIEHTREAIELGQDQVVLITPAGIEITDFAGAPAAGKEFHIDWDASAAEKGGYDYFMLKEIAEQPQAIADTLMGRLSERGEIVLDEVRLTDQDLRDVDKVFVIACGTSYHAAMVAKYAIEHWTRLPCEVELASEFRYRDPILDRSTLVIVISQSGETMDTLMALRHAKEQKARVLAICNTNGSTIPRESDAVLYTHGGPEIAVASTKAFLTQLVACYLIGLHLAQVRGVMYADEVAAVVSRLRRTPDDLRELLANMEDVRALARELKAAPTVLFIGRHVGFPVALEGALKLKELAYMHAEGFAAGELKHGPISLIDDGTPVVCVVPSPAGRGVLRDKVVSNIQEVRARGARTIVIAEEGDDDVRAYADHLIVVPRTPTLLAPLMTTVPLQILACEIAAARGHDVDQPRNLAKSVTVE